MKRKRSPLKKRHEDMLRKIVSESIYGPGGDPSDSNLISAALAYVILRESGCDMDDLEGAKECLEGENVYDENFLEGDPLR